MIRFSGLEVRPVSSVTAYPVCRIDRVLVSAYQTLYLSLIHIYLNVVLVARSPKFDGGNDYVCKFAFG